MVCLRQVGFTLGADGRGGSVTGSPETPATIDLLKEYQEFPFTVTLTGGRCEGQYAWLLGYGRTQQRIEPTLAALRERRRILLRHDVHTLAVGGSVVTTGHPVAPESYDARVAIHDQFSLDLDITRGDLAAIDGSSTTQRAYTAQFLFNAVGIEIGPFVMLRSRAIADPDVADGERPDWELRLGLHVAFDFLAGRDERMAAPLTWDGALLLAIDFVTHAAQYQQLAFTAAFASYLYDEAHTVSAAVAGLATLPQVFAAHDAFFSAALEPESAVPPWVGLVGEGTFATYHGIRAGLADAGPERVAHVAMAILGADLVADGTLKTVAPRFATRWGAEIRTLLSCTQFGGAFAQERGERSELLLFGGLCVNEVVFKPLGRFFGFLPETEPTVW